MGYHLIKNGLLYDGMGNQPQRGDLLIENDRIARMGGSIDCREALVTDAEGMAVTPGFVDIHRHCDRKPLEGRGYGTSILAQGITTVVVGNCGMSTVPMSREMELFREAEAFYEPVLGTNRCRDIFTFHEYMGRLKTVPFPVNFGVLQGCGTIRTAVKGFDSRPFTGDELERAVFYMEEALEEGALGASVGIMYLPECFNTIDEHVRLLEPVGKRKRPVCAHIRGEGDSLIKSVLEIIEIGRRAGVPVEISHFKSCGMENWRKDICRAIEAIETARERGQDVTCDFYPYNCGSTALTTMIPPNLVKGDLTGALRRLETTAGVEEFREACSRRYPDWDNYAITLGWNRIILSAVSEARNEKYLGLNIEEAAGLAGFEDGAAFAAYLMRDENGKTAIINRSMCQEDIDTVARLPYSSVISDSIYAETDRPHPRMNGAFPKIIREYVLERSVLTMEEAVRKMTSLPAKRMGIKDRGSLTPGYFADINIFRPEEFKDQSDYIHPGTLPKGLARCILNGKTVVENDKIRLLDGGRLIRA